MSSTKKHGATTAAATAASSLRRSEVEPLLLVHPRLDHGDGAQSPSSAAFSFSGDDDESDAGGGASAVLRPRTATSRQKQQQQYQRHRRARSDGVVGSCTGIRGAHVPWQGPIEEEERVGGKEGGSVGWFVWLLTVSACVSGLLFGYDTGVISATLVSIDTSLSHRTLSALDKSLITSATALLGLVASPLSSILADAHGRRPVILLADAAFVLGALAQAAASTVPQMILGRAVVGVAVGMSSFATPLYIAELAPARVRGRLVTVNVLCITLGQVVAYIVGWVFAEHWNRQPDVAGEGNTGWRWMVGLGAVPAIVQGLLLLFWMPETPRWLVKVGRVDDAAVVIRKTLGVSEGGDAGEVGDKEEEARSSLEAIEAEVRAEEEQRAKLSRRRRGSQAGGDCDGSHIELLAGCRELFGVPKNRRALTIACLLQGLQQLCGFNSLMYFSATIFELLGFTVPTLTSLTVAATNFAFTVLALLFVDRIGRRRILLYSVPFMVAGLLLAAVGFRSVRLSSSPPALPPTDPTSPHEIAAAAAIAAADTPDLPTRAPQLILFSMMLFTAAYALGLGNVPWMQSELFPLGVRSLGSGLATSTNWLANFAVGLTFLPLMESLSPSWTFVGYAAVCAAGWLAIWAVYPETAGLTLEEAAGLLDEGWGVRR